jgi:hypothetical protein
MGPRELQAHGANILSAGREWGSSSGVGKVDQRLEGCEIRGDAEWQQVAWPDEAHRLRPAVVLRRARADAYKRATNASRAPRNPS